MAFCIFDSTVGLCLQDSVGQKWAKAFRLLADVKAIELMQSRLSLPFLAALASAAGEFRDRLDQRFKSCTGAPKERVEAIYCRGAGTDPAK